MATKRWGLLAATVALAAVGSIEASAAPLSPKEELGKYLFFDKISTPAASMSCATCHAPRAGWVGAIGGINLHGSVYRGADPRLFGNRKPPSAAYASFSPVFEYFDYKADGRGFAGGVFWDGRATGERLGEPTAEQALGPPLNPVEQNMPSAQAVCDHVAASRHASLFDEAWGPGALDCSAAGIAATYDRIGLSIAAYEASSEVNSFSSRFDRYWRACTTADNSADDCGRGTGGKADLDPQGILSEQEFAGLVEFGEYCSDCHVGHEAGPGGVPPLFTDNTFDNIGVPKNPENPFYRMPPAINPDGANWVDLGLGGFLRSRPEWAAMASDNDGKHRVPTIRNVDARPGKGFPKAYMHNGALKSLKEVVHFYNTRDVATWPPPEVDRNVNREVFEGKPLGNFELSEEEEDAIVAFMKTLTDEKVAKPPTGFTGR